MVVTLTPSIKNFGGCFVGTPKTQWVKFESSELGPGDITISNISFATGTQFSLDADSITLPKTIKNSGGAFVSTYPFTFQSICYYDNRIWSTGGQWSGTTHNDVIYSQDNGYTWTLAAATAPFTARCGHCLLSYDGKMWIIGGSTNATFTAVTNNVYWSTDGETWTLAAATAPFTARALHSACVFENEMWIAGGANGIGGGYTDLWHSTDGETWTQETQTGDTWSARVFPVNSAIVYNGRMFIIGGWDGAGAGYRDVYSSADGIAWSKEVTTASWGARYAQSVGVNNGKLIVAMGITTGPTQYKDCWESTNGSTWTQTNSDITGDGITRSFFPAVSTDEGLVFLGGNGTPSYKREVLFTANNYGFEKRLSTNESAAQFKIIFDPTTSGTKTDTITVTSTDSGSPDTMTVSGRAYDDIVLTPSDSDVNFGSYAVGETSSPEEVTISTTCQDYVTVTQTTISSPFTGKLEGVDPGYSTTVSEFVVVSNPLDMSLLSQSIISGMTVSAYGNDLQIARVGTTDEYILVFGDSATSKVYATILEITDGVNVSEKTERRIVLATAGTSFTGNVFLINMGNDRYVVSFVDDNTDTIISLFSYTSSTLTLLDNLTESGEVFKFFTSIANFENDRVIKLSSTKFALTYNPYRIRSYSIAGDSIAAASAVTEIPRAAVDTDDDIFGIYEIGTYTYAVMSMRIDLVNFDGVQLKTVIYNNIADTWDVSASWNTIAAIGYQCVIKKISNTKLMLIYSDYTGGLPPYDFYAKMITISGTTYTDSVSQILGSYYAGAFVYERSSGKWAIGAMSDTAGVIDTVSVKGVSIDGNTISFTGEALDCTNFTPEMAALAVPFAIIDEYTCLLVYNNSDATIHACVVMLADKVTIDFKGVAAAGTVVKSVTFTSSLTNG